MIDHGPMSIRGLWVPLVLKDLQSDHTTVIRSQLLEEFVDLPEHRAVQRLNHHALAPRRIPDLIINRQQRFSSFS